VHGALWLLDELVGHLVIKPASAAGAPEFDTKRCKWLI